MLQVTESERLSRYLVGIVDILIEQVDINGNIRVTNGDDISLDVVSAYHVIEVLLRFGNGSFPHHTKLMSKALEKNYKSYPQFVTDAISQMSPNDQSIVKRISENIDKHQLDSGSFDTYTAYLLGGNFFSTLWSIKIIQNIGEKKYEDAVVKAFQYLVSNSNDSKLPISQLGFLYMLIKRSTIYHNDIITKNIREKLIQYLKSTEISAESLIWILYICEDLLIDSSDEEAKLIVEKKISQIMNLEEEKLELPPVLIQVKDSISESVFFHCLARLCIVSFLVLPPTSHKEIIQEMYQTLQLKGHKAAFEVQILSSELKRYLDKFGGIHKEFGAYNDNLQHIWRETPFGKSIFIMMPFEDDDRYDILTDAIKKTCKDRGYHAIRTDDTNRKKYDRLWDNIVLNMLSCKYAIAVYVNKGEGLLRNDSELNLFPNPNVSLEFGFFKSRGQKILLLKDKKSSLPTDLKGFYWNDFEISRPKDGVRKAVNLFLDQIEFDT